MVMVSYNILPTVDASINGPYLVEKMVRFENITDAKSFIDALRTRVNKQYTLVGKPLIN